MSLTSSLRKGTSSVFDTIFASSLLSLSLCSSYLSSSSPTSVIYLNLCKASVGLVICSWVAYFQDIWMKPTGEPRNLSTLHICLAALQLYILPPDSRNNCYILYWTVLALRPVILWMVRKFPGSFSFGEASLISQSALLLTSGFVMNILNWKLTLNADPMKEMAKIMVWNLESLSQNKPLVVKLFVCWAVLVVMSVSMVGLYTSRGWPVTTRTRKIFHIAIVLVYWSGLQYCHLFLLISTYAALFLMIFVEYIRISKLFPPVSRYLTQKLTPFLDAKDSGKLILTPIYLLVGLSLPLWIWPEAAKPNPVNQLSLYSGVISVGVADTAAAVVGSAVGRIKWMSGGSRTVEGSFAALLSSLAAVFILSSVSAVEVGSWSAVVAACVAVVLTEAFSNQVDNLTLPLVMMSALNILALNT